jgi:hypothetical protein
MCLHKKTCLFEVFGAVTKKPDVCLGVTTCCLLQLYLRNYTGSNQITRCHVRIDNNFTKKLFPITTVKMYLLTVECLERN